MKKANNLLISSIIFSIVFLLTNRFLTPSVFAQSTVDSWTHIGLNNLVVNTLVSDPTNSSHLYAGTSDGVYQSTDGGNTWTAESNQGASASVVVIAPSDHNILYATHGGTGIQKSIDGGATWSDVTNNLGSPVVILDLAVDPIDPNTVIVAPYGHCLGIRKTTDGGATWNAVGGGCDIYRIVYDPNDPNIVYAGGTNFSGYFVKSTDSGNTWNSFNQGLASPGAIHGIAVDPNNPSNIYTGAEDIGVYKTSNGGTNWNLLPNSPSVQILNALAVNPLNSNVYAQSSNGVSQSIDGGNTWTAINAGDTPTGIEKLVILPNDPNNLYAATDTGIYVYGLQSPNLAPTIHSIANATINKGSTYTASSSFTDPDSTSWTATVDYGDGSGSHPLALSGMNFALSHAYNTPGTYTETVSVTDNQGATGTQTATIAVVPTPTWLYDAGSYAGKSGFVTIAGTYFEPPKHQYDNYCGPGASQELISAWTSNVPDINKLASEEKTDKKTGTLMVNMVGPINKYIGQNYYTTSVANKQADFSNMIGRDIFDNHHPLLTGLQTRDDKGNQLIGWDKISAPHIITIYGFDFTSPNVGYIYYYDTASQDAGNKAGPGSHPIDYKTFWTLVQFNPNADIQLHGQ